MEKETKEQLIEKLEGIRKSLQERKSSSFGITFYNILFVVFLVLKLTGFIDWSWWWVTCPLWGPWALIIAIFVFVLLIWLIGSVVVGIINLFV